MFFFLPRSGLRDVLAQHVYRVSSGASASWAGQRREHRSVEPGSASRAASRAAAPRT